MTRTEPNLPNIDDLTEAHLDALATSLDAAPRDAADDELLTALHSLPRVGNEPVWTDLERSIRRNVDANGSKKSSRLIAWWRSRWAFMVPMGLAAAAALMLVMHRAPHAANKRSPEMAVATIAATDAPVATTTEPVTALWLNGSEVDLSGIDDDDADDLLDSLDDPPAPRHSHIHHDERGPEVATDMLRSMDFTWIDHLDDQQLDTLDSYLDHQPA